MRLLGAVVLMSLSWLLKSAVSVLDRCCWPSWGWRMSPPSGLLVITLIVKHNQGPRPFSQLLLPIMLRVMREHPWGRVSKPTAH